MRGLIALLAVALAVSFGLSGCGRKNPPKPPMAHMPKDDAGEAGAGKAGGARSTDGEFKEYRPIRNHGNQP